MQVAVAVVVVLLLLLLLVPVLVLVPPSARRVRGVVWGRGRGVVGSG